MQDKTIFVIVPSTSLVEQLYSDFEDYSSFKDSNWTVSSHVQKISGKYSKFVNKQVVVTTWQSLDKLPHSIYEDLGAVFVDETHTASANILTNILERCTTTPHRHGLTGTLDGSECLHGDSEVRMHDNSLKKIKDIVVGDLVKTLNESTGEIENKEVKYIYKNLSISKKERRFEIEFENGKVLRLTGNHKVFVRSYGWKRADQLEEGDDIICVEEYYEL
jgi:superfamily II DNA or RNA helicase